MFKIQAGGQYKVELEMNGYQQVQGLDHGEIFSPVLNISSFIVSFIYTKKVMNRKEIKYVLIKALYGLKQAPLRCNEYFTNFLKENGMYGLRC